MDAVKGYMIVWKGLAPGTYAYDFVADDALFEAYGSNEIRGGLCNVHVEMTRADGALDLQVAILGEVRVPCDRCLEDCSVPIDFKGRLLVRISDEQGEYDGEVMWVAPAAGEVDLAQYVYESIVLSLPYRRVHPDGTCDPDMLSRFSVATEEEFARIEARAAADEEDASSMPDDVRRRLTALRRRLEQDEEKR